MEVVFIDWKPVEKKSDIRSGGHIRRYYAWISLKATVECLIPFRIEKEKIHWKAISCMFNKRSKIWVEYGSGRTAHIFVLAANLIKSKKFILNVHDFVVQQASMYKEAPFFKRIQLQIIERLLLKRASFIILPCPGLLDYFTPKKNQKILIMPPGVGGDEPFVPPRPRKEGKNIALYFGGMMQKGMIPYVIKIFSDLNDWELHLVGPKEGEEIVGMKNIKYIGAFSHDELPSIISNADAILILSPNNDYSDKAMNIKLGYALRSCRPIITTKLSGISKYVSTLGLEKNVIYIDEWNLQNLKDALNKVKYLNIDSERTLEIMREMIWEKRFNKVNEIVLDISTTYNSQIEWV